MVDKVIITLTHGKREFDMEFPADVVIDQIKPTLIRALQYKGIFIAEPFELACNGHTLNNSDTFLECGVWDGSYVNLICGGRST